MQPDLALRRLQIQQLVHPRFKQPDEVVAWLGAVQAQDYAGAKWAVGQRLPGADDAAVERAFAAGTILRTHVLRPTWHFVTPADIGWMIALTGPRVNALAAYSYKRLGLDDAVFTRTNKLLAKALRGGQQLTRLELGAVLSHAGIALDDSLRLLHILMRAELDGVVCSGARRGKQHTYALLEERAPLVRRWEREEALAELAKRYYASRGPATLQDYVWWSGLTAADARAGLETVKAQLDAEEIDGQTYWSATVPAVRDAAPTAHLLPNYDEYMVGYRDRRAIIDPSHIDKLNSRDNSLLGNAVVVDGQIVGTWKRTLKGGAAVVAFSPVTPLTAAQRRAIAAAAQRYGEFLGQPVVLQTNGVNGWPAAKRING